MTDRMIDRRINNGEWMVIYKGVYRFAGVPSSWRQAVMALILWGGQSAVASYRTAAALWNFDGFPEGPVEMSLDRKVRAPSDGVTVHATRLLPKCDVTTLGCIRLTAPTRTLIDLCAVCDEEALERALESALRRRLTSIPRLKWRLSQIGRGTKGVRRLQDLIDKRDPGMAPTDSDFETLLHQLLKPTELPALVRQHEVFENGRFVARPDFSWPRLKIAIEADSYAFHGGRVQWEATIRRRNRLVRLGWIVVPVTYDALKNRPQEVLADIRAAYQERMADPRFPVDVG